MKRALIVCALCLAAAAGFAAPTVSLTGGLAAGFDAVPTVQEALQAFQGNRPMWGVGWEVVPRRVGVGATYMVSFFRDTQSRWTMDWYGAPLYMSFHAFGGGAFLDPYIQAGIGSMGRVLLEPAGTAGPDLYISLFPYAAAGLALTLDSFVIGARLSYAPFNTAVPVTSIPAYPMGSFSVAVYTGVSLR